MKARIAYPWLGWCGRKGVPIEVRKQIGQVMVDVAIGMSDKRTDEISPVLLAKIKEVLTEAKIALPEDMFVARLTPQTSEVMFINLEPDEHMNAATVAKTRAS